MTIGKLMLLEYNSEPITHLVGDPFRYGIPIYMRKICDSGGDSIIPFCINFELVIFSEVTINSQGYRPNDLPIHILAEGDLLWSYYKDSDRFRSNPKSIKRLLCSNDWFDFTKEDEDPNCFSVFVKKYIKTFLEIREKHKRSIVDSLQILNWPVELDYSQRYHSGMMKPNV